MEPYFLSCSLCEQFSAELTGSGQDLLLAGWAGILGGLAFVGPRSALTLPGADIVLLVCLMCWFPAACWLLSFFALVDVVRRSRRKPLGR